MNTRLSILVATVPQRRPLLDRLLERLRPQLVEAVEVVVAEDDAEATIGAKRNTLLDAARGLWVAHVDDDDLVAPDYVPRVLSALWEDPDAVEIWSDRYRDGRFERLCRYAHGLEHTDAGPHLTRPIMHLCPVRTSIARTIGFRDVSFGEDTDFAKRLAESGMIRVLSSTGPAPIYTYLQRSAKPELPKPRGPK